MTGSGRRVAGALCWQSHQVPPLQEACSCRRQHRQIMFSLSLTSCQHIRVASQVAGQAAFALARRIRLRRSAERSSSFKPPQVPYFSGLPTA
jgi:hypothetical protein